MGRNSAAYMRAFRARKRAALDALKTGPCVDCCGRFPPECMDFDHVGDKAGVVSRMYALKHDKLLAEVAKCELVCSNCHRIRTRKRGR